MLCKRPADEWICPGCKKAKTYQKKQNVITECRAMLLVQLKLFATVFVEGSVRERILVLALSVGDSGISAEC